MDSDLLTKHQELDELFSKLTTSAEGSGESSSVDASTAQEVKASLAEQRASLAEGKAKDAEKRAEETVAKLKAAREEASAQQKKVRY